MLGDLGNLRLPVVFSPAAKGAAIRWAISRKFRLK
jgi:hypothetical protein